LSQVVKYPNEQKRTTILLFQTSSSGQLNLAKNWETVGHTSDSSKKSRTIHIDVYCTDTDMELSETSSDSWESTSTPQTVFESRNVCVTHERASDSGLPFKLKRRSRKKPSNLTKYVEMDDSDNDDVSSTSYPSKIDSYSTINDFSSSISSIKSWKSHSLLSCSNDSVKNFNRAGILPSVGKPVLHELNTERKYVTRGNPSQDYGKHTLKQQTPYSKTLILNENNDIKENMINKKNEKHFKACGKGISSLKSSESNSCIKHKEEISHPKLDVNSTTSCPVLEILPNPRCTEQLASRFDQVINIFKNPGRHKGPTKNPDCNCDYCRRYFM
ncbi:uncharacterized protein LOC108915390, partial [Anoplophora glabripennis]|uniref:uncharacterized protein LOC108915390 n=1 Tax=Anoplophora glabripennis TaxID=217634 RepID=UPI0008750B37